MAQQEDPEVPVWGTILHFLEADDRITPQMWGFLHLASPRA